MAQDLFTSKYPVPGQRVCPASYGPSRWSYVFLSIPSMVSVVLVIDLVLSGEKTITFPMIISFLGFALIWAILVFAGCKSLHFDITPKAITYSSLWRKPRTILFSEIGSAVIINYKYVAPGRDYRSRRTPRLWTLLLAPKHLTDGRPLRIPLTWIDWTAHDEIIRILEPADWTPN